MSCLCKAGLFFLFYGEPPRTPPLEGTSLHRRNKSVERPWGILSLFTICKCLPEAVTQTCGVFVKQVVFLTVNHRGPLPAWCQNTPRDFPLFGFGMASQTRFLQRGSTMITKGVGVLLCNLSMSCCFRLFETKYDTWMHLLGFCLYIYVLLWKI